MEEERFKVKIYNTFTRDKNYMNEKFYLNSDIIEICENLKSYSKIFSGKIFLISGANGFLGKYFIKTLTELNKNLRNKVKVIAIDIKFDKCEIYKDKNVKKIKIDINKIDKLKFKSDYVLHAAGIPSPKHYYNKPIEAIFTSITEQRNIRLFYKNRSKLFFLVVVKYMVIQTKEIFQQKKHIMEMYRA